MHFTPHSILMVRPANFGFNSETAASNAFQNNSVNCHEYALREFDQFIQLLHDKGVEVIVIEDTDSPIKPDAIFPNNWFCTLPDGRIFLFPMLTKNRRTEVRSDIIEQLKCAYDITEVIDWTQYAEQNVFLEGTGSIVFHHSSKTAFACISPRTNPRLFNSFCNEIGYKAVAFDAFDLNGTPYYHTNVMMALGEKWCVICLDAIENQLEKSIVTSTLKALSLDIIEISLQQVSQFCGNIFEVQNCNQVNHIICSKTAFESFNREQKDTLSKYGNVIYSDIHTIEKVGGGSTRCMMAGIYLEEKH